MRLTRRRYAHLRRVARELRSLRETMDRAELDGDRERAYELLFQVAAKTKELDALLEP